jgi:hypothetical protein
MRRSLRTILAEVLRLRELRERYLRNQADAARCGVEPCGLDLPKEEPQRRAVRRADHRITDYRTPERCETDGDRSAGALHGAGVRKPVPDRETDEETDTLFRFLKSLHEYLMVPQEAATGGASAATAQNRPPQSVAHGERAAVAKADEGPLR